ncbi:MAG: alpha/beta hydrolase, partial [Proteobacteria bacterium]|nr:alpha/beta hydrolase [Pseudomonadota bacterium]
MATPRLDPLRDLEQRADPFGILASCREVQSAWLGKPGLLAKETGKLLSGALLLQQQAIHRFLGGDGKDAVTPVAEDERFQDPIWTENAALDTLKEYYLLWTRWLEDAIFEAPGVED